MERRKIQLVAGTTYVVSLPKQWVVKNGLKQKEEVLIDEAADGKLHISTDEVHEKNVRELEISIDEYGDTIGQMLLSSYYLGTETIILRSNNAISKSHRKIIRKNLQELSGTEIGYEDSKKIVVKVLLDNAKVQVPQLLYRMSLLLDMTMENISSGIDIQEIEMSESEIDRLYNLVTKIVSLALKKQHILEAAKIRNIMFIPSLFLLSKRLEHIGDNLLALAYQWDQKSDKRIVQDTLSFIRKELARTMKHINKEFPSMFRPCDEEKIQNVKQEITNMKSDTCSEHLRDAVRYLADMQDQVLTLSFHRKLLREGKL